MAERDEDLCAVSVVLRDVTADLNLAALIVVLVTQPLEDPPGRVSLLRWRVPIRLQDLVDQPDERTQLGLRRAAPEADNPAAPVLEDLLERPPAHLVVTADLALRDPLDEHPAPDLCPQLHVGVHPSPVPLAGPSEEASGSPHEPNGDRQVLPFSTITNPSQVLSFSKSVYRCGDNQRYWSMSFVLHIEDWQR